MNQEMFLSLEMIADIVPIKTRALRRMIHSRQLKAYKLPDRKFYVEPKYFQKWVKKWKYKPELE